MVKGFGGSPDRSQEHESLVEQLEAESLGIKKLRDLPEAFTSGEFD